MKPLVLSLGLLELDLLALALELELFDLVETVLVLLFFGLLQLEHRFLNLEVLVLQLVVPALKVVLVDFGKGGRGKSFRHLDALRALVLLAVASSHFPPRLASPGLACWLNLLLLRHHRTLAVLVELPSRAVGEGSEPLQDATSGRRRHDLRYHFFFLHPRLGLASSRPSFSPFLSRQAGKLRGVGKFK